MSYFGLPRCVLNCVRAKWLRALDGLNARDDAYRLSISGGVTVSDCKYMRDYAH